MVAPFFSCGAKLPIWTAFGMHLFGGNATEFVIYGIYLIGIVVAVITSFILKKFFFKGELPPFIMELPNYHLPRLYNLMLRLWEKTKHFLIKASTIIAASTIVIWFLSNFSFAFWNGMVEETSESMLSLIGKGLRWLFVPAGFGMSEEFGWMCVVGSFTGLIAKEMVVSTMEVLTGVVGISGVVSAIGWQATFAFMAFNLLSIPCMAAVAAAAGEFNSKKNTAKAICFWLITSYTVSVLIYWCCTFWWLGLIILAVLAGVITAFKLRKRVKKEKTSDAMV